jgi:predicted AlkP superfamily phosphohydrolase/phosphomutase
MDPRQCGEPPFWSILDHSGKRSVILDVPFAYPLEHFGGVQILDWGTYERHYRAHSIPEHALAELSARFGDYPFNDAMSRDVPSSARQFRRARHQLLAGITAKGKVISWLLSNHAWDFLMAAFCETHPAGHYFWRFQSAGRDESETDGTPEFTNTIREVYKAIDRELAKIIASLNDQTMLVVLSGQGMGPNRANWQLIPEVLVRLGLLVNNSTRSYRKIAPTEWLAKLRNSIPLNWRRAVSRHLPGALRDYLRVYWANTRIDVSRTRAFALPTDQFGYIRINLKGREPNGVVEPGSEYSALCETLCKVLKTLFDSRTGKPIVREVFKASETFPGPRSDYLPDLIVTWRDEAMMDGAFSDIVGHVYGKMLDPRSGNHRAEGFAIFYGPGVKKAQDLEARIVDIAPTILRYFGLNVPCSIDGKALPGLLC